MPDTSALFNQFQLMCMKSLACAGIKARVPFELNSCQKGNRRCERQGRIASRNLKDPNKQKIMAPIFRPLHITLGSIHSER